MASVNKVILIGHLGRDPEVRYTPSGASVSNFSIATSRAWKDKSTGEKQEETEWHRLVAYDRTAEIVGEYLKKGAPVYVEGRLKTRKWEKDGVERYSTEIVVESLTMLGSKTDSEPTDNRPRSGIGSNKPAPTSKTGTGFDDMDDDIPF